MFVDTHCHLYRSYYEDLDDVIEQIKQSEIYRVINNGCDKDTNCEVLESVSKYDLVYGAIGNLSTGMASSFDISNVSREINAAMGAINTGIETSLNPTINPNITIDTNYKMMALAMKEALKDMEVELDDREVGQFVIKTVEQEIYS